MLPSTFDPVYRPLRHQGTVTIRIQPVHRRPVEVVLSAPDEGDPPLRVHIPGLAGLEVGLAAPASRAARRGVHIVAPARTGERHIHHVPVEPGDVVAIITRGVVARAGDEECARRRPGHIGGADAPDVADRALGEVPGGLDCLQPGREMQQDGESRSRRIDRRQAQFHDLRLLR